MDLSILIPTMNRHEFLARTLEYYKIVGFDGYIIIGDSSTDDQLQKNSNLIASMNQLNIIYRVYSNPPYLHDGMVTLKMNEEVCTKYIAQTGDDDFLVMPNIQKCIDFLESNSDFISAHGKRVGLKLKDDKPYGDFVAYSIWPEQDWVKETPIERWLNYTHNSFSSHAWVVYADIWKKLYEKSNQIPSRYLGPEYLPCSLQAILGKSKELDFLSLVCQVGRHQTFDIDKQSLFDLMSLDTWPQSIQTVERTLVDILHDPQFYTDWSKPIEEVVHAELWHHLMNWMAKQFQRKYKPGQKEKDNLLEDAQETIPLKLTSDWVYYEDFKPIYDILIHGPYNTYTN